MSQVTDEMARELLTDTAAVLDSQRNLGETQSRLSFSTIYYTALQHNTNTALQYNTTQYNKLEYTGLHHIVLHYTTLHCTAVTASALDAMDSHVLIYLISSNLMSSHLIELHDMCSLT